MLTLPGLALLVAGAVLMLRGAVGASVAGGFLILVGTLLVVLAAFYDRVDGTVKIRRVEIPIRRR